MHKFSRTDGPDTMVPRSFVLNGALRYWVSSSSSVRNFIPRDLESRGGLRRAWDA
jgi:hypothetical protein